MSNCESCLNYEYDEEYEYYVCTKNCMDAELEVSFRDNPAKVYIFFYQNPLQAPFNNIY